MFLENELYTAYFKNGFGKILKSEIDLYVFHYFLLKELNCINNDSGTVSEIPYLKIEKKDLYNLASIANISISKLQNLLENDFNVFCKNKAIFIHVIFNPNHSYANDFYICHIFIQKIYKRIEKN